MDNPTPQTHTYIHTYTHMKKRRREIGKTEKRTNVIFYDEDNLKKFQEICRHNNTDVSSVLSNLVDLLVANFDEKPVTLDKYVDPNYMPTPEISAPIEKYQDFLKKQNLESRKDYATKFYRAYTLAEAYTQMTPQEIEEHGHDHLYLWKKYVM